MKHFDLSVYLVTDRHCLRGRDFYVAIEEALKAGVTLLQLREKDASYDELLEEGRRVQALCRQYGVPFLVDDNVEVAKALDADGVHLGQEDEAIEKAQAALGRDKIIGISAHNIQEAVEAQRKGADYLGVGALYPTGSKKDASVLAPDVFRQVVQSVTIPVVGIGGIHEAQYGDVLDQGAAGCAMISGILGADDITATVKRLKAIAAQHKQKG